MSAPITDADLTILRLIHTALRRDLARLTAAVQADGNPATLPTLRGRWTVFAEQLHDHHVAEGRLVWPVLQARAGGVADAVLEEMAAEHGAIDPALDAVATCLDTAIADPSPGNRERLDTALRRLAVLLEANLAHEEAAAIPLVCRYLTRADLDHVSAVQRKENGLRGGSAVLPLAARRGGRRRAAGGLCAGARADAPAAPPMATRIQPGGERSPAAVSPGLDRSSIAMDMPRPVLSSGHRPRDAGAWR